MSQDPKILDKLRELTQMRTDDAAVRLAQLMATERQASDRLAMLERYHEEYRSAFLERLKEGITTDAWRNYQAFLAKLDAAIDQQRAIAEQSSAQTEAGRNDWMHQRNRGKAIDALTERHHNRQMRVMNRREQKMLDEHAARGTRYRDD